MPSKKKKYNARFPPARIKKIMQTDDEVGKVAAAVPVIISRALELFVESLITKANEFTQLRNAKTLSTLHLKQCILSENKFDFLKDLVVSIPDVQIEDDTSNSSLTSPAAVTAPVANELVKGNQPKTRQKRRRRKFKQNDLDDSAGPSNSGAEESENSEDDDDESDVEEEDDDDDDDDKRYCADPQLESTRSTNSVYPTSSFQLSMMRATTGVASTTNPDDEDYDS